MGHIRYAQLMLSHNEHRESSCLETKWEEILQSHVLLLTGSLTLIFFSESLLQRDCCWSLEILAVSIEQLIYDSNLNFTRQPSRPASQPFSTSAPSKPPLCPPDWQEADGKRDGLLSSLASTLCPCSLNE